MRGVELRLLCHGARERGDSLGQLGRERRGPGCERQTPTAAHEQRIVERRPQPGQRVADGRGGHVQYRGGARHAALLEHRVEDEQAVEVD